MEKKFNQHHKENSWFGAKEFNKTYNEVHQEKGAMDGVSGTVKNHVFKAVKLEKKISKNIRRLSTSAHLLILQVLYQFTYQYQKY